MDSESGRQGDGGTADAEPARAAGSGAPRGGRLSADGSALPREVLAATCRTREVIDLVADKWKLTVLCALVDGTHRTNELQRRIPGLTPKMLTQTLRRLEADGLVQRETLPVVPPHVEYTLTPLGCSLDEALSTLIRWGDQHIPDVERARQRGFNQA